ncbi:hypothetical protein [Streptomyces sp. NPDC026673]|uniref:hypothetical protein n=1 Tax=Streptomyces sp. NPDC026673 TaxID=3155724 RepID=UPI0033E11FFC
MLPAALALLPMCGRYTVDGEWGRLLACAFQAPHTSDVPLTVAQRAFLRALADRDACWGAAADSASWLRAAGLPTGRAGLRELLARAPPGTR